MSKTLDTARVLEPFEKASTVLSGLSEPSA
jgi:hypothetical protein